MKKLIISLALLLLTKSALPALTPIDTLPPIKFSFTEDGRRWKLGNSSKNDQIALSEHVLENETLESWTELVTTLSIVGNQVAPLERIFDAFVKQIQGSLPDAKIQAKVIGRGPHNLFAEWWIKEGSPNDQHEWIQIFEQKDNLAILRYTTKKMGEVDTKGKVWESILDKARLAAPIPNG